MASLNASSVKKIDAVPENEWNRIPLQKPASADFRNALGDFYLSNPIARASALMAELSDGFIALPGGIGTLEEIFEIWTWAQLGFHQKPVGLLNVAGYFDSLVALIDHSVEEQFVKPTYRQMFAVETSPQRLLDRFAEYRAPSGDKWH